MANEYFIMEHEFSLKLEYGYSRRRVMPPEFCQRRAGLTRGQSWGLHEKAEWECMMTGTQGTTHRFRPECALDYMPRQELRQVQLNRLRAVVQRAWDRVPLFRSRMNERGLLPENIRSLDDVAKLPFTVKADLRDTYPFGLFASPMREVVRLHASSGTTGKPIVVAYTQEDLDVWTSVMARALAACGVAPTATSCRTPTATGCSPAGWAPLRRRGAGRHGDSHLRRQHRPPDHGHEGLRVDGHLLHARAISCTWSSAPSELGVDLRELPLRVGVFGAEPWTESMRSRIEEAEPASRPSTSTGSRRSSARASAVECQCQDGLHIFEDHFYPEIVDPETGQPLPDGQEGELVLTTLSKQAMPMIRYRTRDITALMPGPCACGRTLRRMRRIGRRSDDMLIIRGVNVFPSQVEAALLEIEGTLPHYQIILTREHGLDQMEVQVEVTPQMFSDKIGAPWNLAKRLSDALDHVLQTPGPGYAGGAQHHPAQ